MRKSKSVLGMAFSDAIFPRPVPEKAPVFGAAITAPSFTKALILHGGMERCEVFTNAGRMNVVARDVKNILRHTTESKLVKIHEYRDLPKVLHDVGITLWFNPFFGFREAAYIRNRWSTKIYPITVLIHSVCSQRALQAFVLPLLLAESFPCDSILCYSQAARDSLSKILDHVSACLRTSQKNAQWYRGRLDVIPLGVDTEKFRPRDKAIVRSQLGLPVKACIILYLGRFSLVEKADLFPTLRVIRDLMTQSVGRKLFLVIAGSPRGSYWDSIKRHMRELGFPRRVRVMTARPEHRHLLFSAADVFISPSDTVQENLGNTPIEAMASGVPQLVADWDGYRESVRHGETGFLVPVHWAQCDSDVCDLSPVDQNWNYYFDQGCMAQSVAMDLPHYAKYLECLVTNDSLRAAMGRASRRRALANYSWPSVIRQYKALATDLIERSMRVKHTLRRVETYDRPSYFKFFGQYATDCLDDDTLVRSASSNGGLAQSSTVMPSYHQALQYRLLDPELLDSALAVLRRGSRSRMRSKVSASAPPAVAMGEIVRHLSRGEIRHPDEIRRHIMWLLKYGFIEVTRS
jgi:D-inositol-3-phosphate glycosyltransferase